MFVGVLPRRPFCLARRRALAEKHTRPNTHTLFGPTDIPSDRHFRQLLAGTPCARFDEPFRVITLAPEGKDVDSAGADCARALLCADALRAVAAWVLTRQTSACYKVSDKPPTIAWQRWAD